MYVTVITTVADVKVSILFNSLVYATVQRKIND